MMRQFPCIIFYFILLACGVGCTSTSTSYPLVLQTAERQMTSHPDSAWTELQQLKGEIDGMSEEIQMYYHLLCIQAKDLLLMTHTDDSLINCVVAFYDTYGDSRKQMLAYYLRGKVYVDMNDTPQALKAFLRSLSACSLPHEELRVRIYNELRILFVDQGLYDDAIQIQKELVRIHTQTGVLHDIAIQQRDLARLYEQQGVQDSASHYYRIAGSTALSNRDSAMYDAILVELTGLLYEERHAQEAKHALRKAEQRDDIEDKTIIHAMLGKVYKDLHHWDSAYYYHLKVTESGNVEKAYHSYRELYDLEKRSKNYAKASEYLEKALDSRNLIQYITQTEAVAKVNALYNYQRTETENNRLALENEQKHSYIYLLFLGLFVSLIILMSIAIYVWKNKQELRMQAEKYRVYTVRFKAKSQAEIQENKRKIERLEHLLEDVQIQKDTLRSQLLTAQKELLEVSNRQNEILQKNRSTQDAMFNNTEICKLFRQAGGVKRIGEEDWKQLYAAIDTYYPLFVKQLYELCPSMSERERKVCILIKALVPVKDISILLECESSAVSKIRKRLYHKITGEEGNAKKMDELIADL